MARSLRENPPFVSPKPLRSLVQVDLTPGYSRQSSVLLGVHRRNMLFCPLDDSLHHGFTPHQSNTEILPNCGPSKANQHLHEP